MTLDELIAYISEKTSLTYDQAKEAAGAAGSWLKGMVPDDVLEELEEFFDSVGDLAGSAANATMDAARKAGDMASDAAEVTGDAAKSMMDKAKRGAASDMTESDGT
jgi:hypothetical protein